MTKLSVKSIPAKLYKTALEVLETEENVKKWFSTKQLVLGGKKPLEYAASGPDGTKELEKVLRRIEQGIPL